MKKGIIKVVACLAVFAVALAGFSTFFNREQTKNTRDMKKPTLPVAYIKLGNRTVNTMFGYRGKVDAATMRSALVPLTSEGGLTLTINPYGSKIEHVTYEVRSADGKTLLENAGIKNLTDVEGGLKEASFTLKSPVLMNREYEIRFCVTLEGESDPVNYYTRIVQRAGVDTDSYLDFVQNFYEKCLDKAAVQEYAEQLEPDGSSDNSSFTSVNIHSSIDQISWGTLAPAVAVKPVPQIKEVNATTVSVAQNYIISAKDESGNTEYYTVDEFYRMRTGTHGIVLLDFERSAHQMFDPNLPVATSSGLNLGVADKDIEYASNANADIVAFALGGELWEYNRSANKCTRVFGSRTLGSFDERLEHGEYNIKIVRVSEAGDISFVVYGYMNTDSEEGRTGIGVYRYTADKDVIEQELFVPSAASFDYLDKNLSSLSYISKKDILYIYMEGSIYKIDFKDKSYNVVKDKIAPGCFVVSKSQSSVAWMDEMQENNSTHITAMSLENGKSLHIEAGSGQRIKALGFVGEDLVYGVANEGDIVSDTSGNTTFAMESVGIKNFAGEMQKEYKIDNVFVTGINLQDNLLELVRVQRQGNAFVPIANDHIMNNTAGSAESVTRKLVQNDRKETEVTLAFTKAGQTGKLLSLGTKITESGKVPTLTIEMPVPDTERYYVYGYGRLIGVYEKVGEAVAAADAHVGVVLDEKQQYVWERGNVKSTERIDVDTLPEGLRAAPLDENTIRQAAGDKMRVMNLSGCTQDAILYQVSNGYPVIAKTSADTSVLVVGYDIFNTWLYDPATGGTTPMAKEDSEKLFAAAGNVFMSYRAADDAAAAQQ